MEIDNNAEDGELVENSVLPVKNLAQVEQVKKRQRKRERKPRRKFLLPYFEKGSPRIFLELVPNLMLFSFASIYH